MNRLLLGICAAIIASPALAADLPPPPPPPPAAPAYVPAPVYNWSGFYFGLNGGYGFGSSKWSTGTLSTGTFDTSGGLIGPTIGANFQTGQFVFGVEGDLDWVTLSGRTSSAPCPTTCQTTNNYVATARGRVGWAFDRFLVFGTGGVAFSDIKGNVTGVARSRISRPDGRPVAASKWRSPGTGPSKPNIYLSACPTERAPAALRPARRLPSRPPRTWFGPA
ncbi:MAG TPA: outer membrane beta-barrel protein [Pirellulales bacterium]|nr:outer membrane beta-barrel protein [Pirellulales bacterium]